ncbi:hypothetical protein LWT02_05075 [Enterobacter bugandensis]|uniref:hypothetical protein n=1 Tax=Enterobacter TaxID=547 RepID=UPI0010A2AF03|nr:hypothetical protein [Enterobacter bugandensis]MCE1956218.1 hypothetical protein [Enterobacter bugandensis]QCE23777.1 hypothetical protein FAI36_13440 [Enterobacter bugandensis]
MSRSKANHFVRRIRLTNAIADKRRFVRDTAEMKQAMLWLLKSFFYLVPALLIVIGIYLFVRFVPGHDALLSIVWVIAISVIYVKYNKWY